MARIGYKHSDETKGKISRALKGGHMSLEWRHKLSARRRGKPFPKVIYPVRRCKACQIDFVPLIARQLFCGSRKRQFGCAFTRPRRVQNPQPRPPRIIHKRLRLRFFILKRDNFTCQYCGRKSPETILEIDHVFPQSRGGDNDPANLITSCRDCNLGKGDVVLSV
jgi:hypothetical protein